MLKIGSVIDGKYKILNVIGKGGMSTVYLAMNERVNKQWAVKEIRKDDYRKFDLDRKEIEMMKKLKHPHLPSIVDVIETDNTLLIVMDYIEGQSLEDILAEQGAVPVGEVLLWAEQLCDVLGYLHSQSPPIIYRDMKPGNVMRKPDGSLMLIDFGAAREYKPENIKDTILLGTRGYAAPEQYRGDGQSDARTDIYCLGVMLFQLLTGESPHELQPITNLKPELSAGLEAVLLKCTRVKKKDRYQSVDELSFALQHYWEYDREYQRKQKKKFGCFLFPAVMFMVAALGTITFGILEHQTKRSTYEAYLLNAKSALTKEEALQAYEKAIGIKPEEEEGYLELLENVFLEDQLLTAKESERLRHILNAYGNGKESNLTVFQKNKSGYERFSYEAGIAYFYKYEDRSNKKNAKFYFEVAAAAENLNIAQKERAKRLALISDYYYRIGMVDEAGDANVTYLDYWTDLKLLTEGNLVAVDNERTALVIYEELIAQMIFKASEFQKAGVEKKDLLEKVWEVSEHLQGDFSKNRKEAVLLLDYVEMAERMIHSAYTGEE